ncbi:mitochondrial tRNA methylthiotransferase CDK5RAP1 [Pectinophora gossypiella]|uniref:mitochondrial tRNA methylthiotransferase CDK5RAP1 n=1 Tax=Pectinophora gossypiella TaxID=13191 RepID=UPI00214E8D62|nr:mitochondrial tRNA methylthiotransferase CDK5RAP1 [Pectinophora gossypiella]
MKMISLQSIQRFVRVISNTSYQKCRCYSDATRLIARKDKLRAGPDLKDFIVGSSEPILLDRPHIPYLPDDVPTTAKRKVFFDVYGCQMNLNDTEIVWSILKNEGFEKAEVEDEADIFLVMTCAIREGAETKIWHRLDHLRGFKRRRAAKSKDRPVKIGILGCMAERLKQKLIEKEKAVDVVAGPDSYRDLPRLLALTSSGQTAVNVLLSLDETYADVVPVRLNQDSVSAFISIMRGCDNMCTYCIVPFTRGRERSRPARSIVEEVRQLAAQGVKEITLLGQNVNSYRDISNHGENQDTQLAKGFKTVYKAKKGGLRFADLLDKVSAVDPEMRIRFTAAHPKDFPDEVLQIVSERPNICKMLHLPAQSGSSTVLERMRRGYTREAYLQLVQHVRATVPGVGLSTDMICGFCGETEEDFQQTLSLLETVDYNVAFLFPYSMREKTTAYHRYTDDVPEHVKKERHNRMIDIYRRKSQRLNEAEIGNTHLVLVEGIVKKTGQLLGRNELYIKVVFDQGEILSEDGGKRGIKPGDYVAVKIVAARASVLNGIPLYHTSIKEFYREVSWGDRNVLNKLPTISQLG